MKEIRIQRCAPARCERRREWTVETEAEAVVVVQAVEVEILGPGRDLPGVVKEREVEVAIDHDPVFPLQQQAVLIPESIAAEAAQRRTAADRRQQEVRDLLVVLFGRVLHAGPQREDPRLAEDRDVLDRLVLHEGEPERVVVVAVIVHRGREEAAAARVVGGGAPVEANRALGMQVVDLRAQPGEGVRRVDGLDRRRGPLTRLLGPAGQLRAAAQHEQAAGREDREQSRTVGTLEAVVGAVVVRRVVADAVEADLRRLAPAADHRQLAAAVEQARRVELGLGAFVVRERVAAAEVDRVVAADVGGMADTKREASARVGAVEEGMPAQRAALEEGVDALEAALAPAGDVGTQRRHLRRLLLFDRRLPRRRLTGLGRRLAGWRWLRLSGCVAGPAGRFRWG